MSNRRKQRPAHAIHLDAVLDVSPELWEIIASSLPRSSLAALCLVCRQFCSVISAILYRDLSSPPLDITQSSLLVETLSNDGALCCPTPSLLMRKLAFRESPSADQNSKVAIEALRGLVSRPHGAELRALHWDSMPGLDHLSRILRDHSNLPNLTELVVKCNAKHVNNFNFIQTRGLRTLEVDLQFPKSLFDEWQLGPKICYKLTQALQILPSSSPLLHAFRFRLTLSPYYEEEFPRDAYRDLVATMNDLMQFPALETLELSVNMMAGDSLDPYDDYLPSTDFQKFLESHPSLVDLTLSAAQTNDVPLLPHLRFFKGTFELGAALLDRPTAPLEKLDLTFTGPICILWDVPLDLPSHPSLTHLRVLANDSDGKPMKSVKELTPDTFADWVSSFRNLVHLEICISRRLENYREDLIRLTKLQSLRIQEYRTTPFKLTCDSAQLKTIFLPNEYTEEIKLILPQLPDLQNVDVCILADVREWDDRYHRMFEPPEMKIDYFFTWTGPLPLEFFVRVSATSLEN